MSQVKVQDKKKLEGLYGDDYVKALIELRGLIENFQDEDLSELFDQYSVEDEFGSPSHRGDSPLTSPSLSPSSHHLESFPFPDLNLGMSIIPTSDPPLSKSSNMITPINVTRVSMGIFRKSSHSFSSEVDVNKMEEHQLVGTELKVRREQLLKEKYDKEDVIPLSPPTLSPTHSFTLPTPSPTFTRMSSSPSDSGTKCVSFERLQIEAKVASAEFSHLTPEKNPIMRTTPQRTASVPIRIPGAPSSPSLKPRRNSQCSPYLRGGSPFHSPKLKGSLPSPSSSPNSSRRKQKKLERARKNHEKRKVKVLQAKQIADMLTPLYHGFYLFWLNRTKHVDHSIIKLWQKLAYKLSDVDRLRHGELLVDFMDVNFNEKVSKQIFIANFRSVFNAHITHQATGVCRQSFTPLDHHGASSCAFTLSLGTSGEWAVTGNENNLLVWDVKSGRVQYTLEQRYSVNVKISPDQLYIASLHARESLNPTGDLCFWDCDALEEPPTVIEQVNGFAFIPFHGHRLCVLGTDGSLDVMELGGQIYNTFQLGNPPFRLPTPMVYALDREMLLLHHEERVQIWDIEAEKMLSTLGDKDWLVLDMGVSPATPNLVALLVRDPEYKNAQDIKIFNFISQQYLYTLNIHHGSIPHDITSFTFTTEGHHIYASSSLADNTTPEIHLFDLLAQKRIKTIKFEHAVIPKPGEAHFDLPLSGPLAVNSNGETLVYCYGKKIYLYNIGGLTFPEAPLRKLLWRHLIIDVANIALDYLRTS